MSSSIPRLATSRYVTPDAYIGQIFRPQGGFALNETRKPCYIGKGDRHFVMSNIGVRRAFLYDQLLSFTAIEPYLATLPNISDGRQEPESGIRLYTSDGNEISVTKWQFYNSNTQVLLSPEAYDSTVDYYIDYQSADRTVQDLVPFDDMRRMVRVGLAPDSKQYDEYLDYYVPMNFGILNKTWYQDPSDPTSPVVSTVAMTEPEFDASGSPTPGIVDETSCEYSGAYNRTYYLVKLSSVGGVSTYAWRAEADQYGNTSSSSTPCNKDNSSSWPTVDVDDTADSITIEGIMVVALVGTAGAITNGTEFAVVVIATPVIEYDERHLNTSLHHSASSIYSTTLANLASNIEGNAVSSDLMSISSISAYSTDPNLLRRNRKLVMRVTAKSATTVTLYWTRDGVEGLDDEGNIVTITISPTPDETFTIDGVVIALGADFATNIDVGEVYSFYLYSPKVFVQAKDDRSYRFYVSSVTLGTLSLTYNSNTEEGGFGVVESVTIENEDGQFVLPGNVYFHARNLVSGSWQLGSSSSSVDIPVKNSFTAMDVLRFGNFGYTSFGAYEGVYNEDVIDWSLTKKTTSTFEIFRDQNGSVTGEPGRYYFILDYTPVSESVIQPNTSGIGQDDIVWITGSAYVYFSETPLDNDGDVYTSVNVTYEYAGDEPSPSQLYYITSYVIRPDAYYDDPIRILSRENGAVFLAPSTINNDLFIMNQIVWDDSPLGGVYFVQVKDADADGVYTKTDYERAIESTISNKDLTDKVLLNDLTALPKLLSVNVSDNDPFNKRDSYVWVGPEPTMKIGDDTTPGTIIYLGRNTLQVYGENPAHGTRILIGHRSATKTIQLEDKTSRLVNLDGTFIAGSLAAKNAGFNSPSETLLRKTITSFDSIEMWSEQENLLLGGSSIIFLNEIGDGIYRIEEDVTVDLFNQNVNLINCMNQIQLTKRITRESMADALISLVPPSVAAGVGIVKAQLVSILRGLVSRGLIANYQDEDGNPRELDPSTDVKVQVDEADKTLYHFVFAIWTRKPIKRLFGLISVDTNNFTLV